MTYDLIIKGGHVLDPGQSIDGIMDVAITDGRIAQIGPDLPSAEAKTVLEIRDPNRYVVPGLIDMHCHVAYGSMTHGVGLDCCKPDEVGVESGVTTVIDAGSIGASNIGVFPAHIIPHSNTRIGVLLNVASFAHTMPQPSDMNSLDELNQDVIARCIANNPGLVSGFKLRLVGSIVDDIGEALVDRAKAISREHQLPLTVHVGDPGAANREHPERVAEVTKHVLKTLEAGDILTHICTPRAGGVMDSSLHPYPELREARANGVILDSALGRGHFDYEVACRQAEAGVAPDTISSDLSTLGQDFHSLLECMSKFMAVGYSLSDVVRMTTVNPARVNHLEDSLGALAVGREADITILDVVEGPFSFLDTRQNVFSGTSALAPVQTIRAGKLYAPRWGTHPWGWLPSAV
jgi:dihydroorotase